MKAADLYAGLAWGPVELLIPQHSITDAGLADVDDHGPTSIDEAAYRAFNGSVPQGGGAGDFQSVLVISGRRYRTALTPRTVAVGGEDAACLPPCRILRRAFARHGLLAVRFDGGRIQYVVDMTRFAAGEGR